MEGDWWYDNIIEPGKLPMLLCLGAFVVTFVLTRVITRLIRAGIGPFKNNVSAGGVHIHHAVPGIILLIIGSLMASIVFRVLEPTPLLTPVIAMNGPTTGTKKTPRPFTHRLVVAVHASLAMAPVIADAL